MTRTSTIVRGSALTILALAGSAAATPGDTFLVSQGPGGVGNLPSNTGFISGDGSTIVYTTSATNIFPADANGRDDIAGLNVQLPLIFTSSVNNGGAQGNNNSGFATCSASGRYVVFESIASNLTPGDTNNTTDVFLRDNVLGTTEMISLDSGGGASNGASGRPVVSADGRFVAFESSASDLVPADTNGQTDIFVRDRMMGTTTRANLTSTGVQAFNGGSNNAQISRDGKYVSFDSASNTLVAGDTNGVRDVFVRDLTALTTVRVSVSSTGGQLLDSSTGPAPITEGGFEVAFMSFANTVVPGDTNFSVDVFVKEVANAASVQRVSVNPVTGVQANFGSQRCAMTPNGRFIAFQSDATNLVAGDTNNRTDIFVYDTLINTMTRVSVQDASGAQGNNNSIRPSISDDGRFIAFESLAGNLNANDTNAFSDVFVHQKACPADFNGDGEVDLADFFEFLNAFDTSDPSADLTGDSTVDLADFFAFLNAFDVSC